MTIKAILLIADHDDTVAAALKWTKTLADQQAAHLTLAWIGDRAERAVGADALSTDKIEIVRHPTLDEPWLGWHARHHDLIVMGLPRSDTAARDQDMHLVEHLARNVGCPVIVLPPRVTPTRVARRIAIAWNAAPPAQRAVRAALPLLAKADAVGIVSIDPDRPIDLADRLQRFLERHRIAATPEPVIGRDADAGSLIAQAVDQLDADLLVMGAWSRPPLAERLFGGATRHLLGRLGVPVMLSA
jgi:nucleotide-binding universal stress UspA family protein